MPILEHPRNGVYLDECHASVFRVKPWHVAAFVVALVLWLSLILAAVAIYRLLRGGA